MAKANFDGCLSRLLAHEGGYTNDPSDPGGPTNFGITIRDYRAYVKFSATAGDVKGARYSFASAATGNSVSSGASYLPGNAAGSASTGGQYL